MKTQDLTNLFFLFIFFILISLLGWQREKINSLQNRIDSITETIVLQTSENHLENLELDKETFFYACTVLDIKHPEIVYAQAQLESGYFTSPLYQSKNNFLGLYDSRKKEYYEFAHWSDCLLGYRDYVQSKWDGNCNYYSFLQDLPYATDPLYISKVKRLAQSHKGN